MFLEGRPPVNVGVTSSGDVFGGTADHLRRRARRPAVQLLRRRRSRSTGRSSLSLRQPVAAVPVRAAGLLADAVLLRPARRRRSTTRRSRRFIEPRPRDRRRARSAAARAFGIYPFNRYRRVEFSAGLVQLSEEYNDPALQAVLAATTSSRPTARRSSATARSCRSASRSSRRRRSSASSARSPATRCGWRTTSRRKIGGTAVAPDLRRRRALLPAPRRHRRAGARASAASRASGDFPDFIYFGGNSEMRGYDYLQFVGQNAVVRQRRAALPAHRGGAHADRRHRRHPRRVLRQHRRRLVQQPAGFKFCDERHASSIATDRRLPARRPSAGSSILASDRPACRSRSTASRQTDHRLPAAGRPRLVRPRASRPSRSASRSTSTGRGGRCSTRTGRTSLFAADGGSSEFRKPRFAVWIGYDF